MFSKNCNDPLPVSDILGSGGIPKPKSLLSSFMFHRLPSQDPQEATRHDSNSRPPQSQPLSLQSHLLPPCLLGDDFQTNRSRTVTDEMIPGRVSDSSGSDRNASVLRPPPFRTWSVASDDHKILPKVPPHYPPFDPNCTAMITDAPPSIVVVRISECLRRRSIAAEYDDESVIARCMTVDRLHFQIQLYRVPSAASQDQEPTLAPPLDAVIVEVRKIEGGSGLSFHEACSKILLAAKGLDTGDDERPEHRRNGIEFKPRSIAKRNHPFSTVDSSRIMKRRRLPTLNDNTNSKVHRSSIAEESLEGALRLLQKDRLECHQLGLERLVNLTNTNSVGSNISRYVSRRMLTQPEQQSGSEHDGRWKLIDCLVHPGAEKALDKEPEAANKSNRSQRESKNDRMVRSFLESPALTAVTPLSRKQSHDRQHHSFASSIVRGGTSLLKKKRSFRKDLQQQHGSVIMSREELKHDARLRSLGLRVFCNVLDNLSITKELPAVLHPFDGNESSQWVQPAFLLSLVQDLQGAGRPPSVSETGYKLASVHEAALAARCLRLLAGYENDDNEREADKSFESMNSDRGKEQESVREFLRSSAVLERLDYARSCGKVTHAVLEYEAELTYHKLTEDERSC